VVVKNESQYLKKKGIFQEITLALNQKNQGRNAYVRQEM